MRHLSEERIKNSITEPQSMLLLFPIYSQTLIFQLKYFVNIEGRSVYQMWWKLNMNNIYLLPSFYSKASRDEFESVWRKKLLLLFFCKSINFIPIWSFFNQIQLNSFKNWTCCSHNARYPQGKWLSHWNTTAAMMYNFFFI